ncbi:hypothetical protein Vqi01_50560 [Micromonospora qiuiae]|uniref:Lantibiotic biosynthesis protein dehydration domain-containing protein n=2 Tax=Micromonospora qiuiae TaxID=502268 RepID=A0ABQ4JK88_9ACTN|nr:hypothetical protein Vqi01_50560 [Micromonospora qiuiae]
MRRADGAPAPDGLDDGWWVPALALHERAHGVDQVTERRDGTSRARFDRWRERYGPRGGPAFRWRLSDVGLDEAGLLRLLAEPSAALAARVARPDWVGMVEAAIRSAAVPPAEVPVPDRWQEAFAWPMRTLVAAAVEQAVARLTPVQATAQLDLVSVAEGFRADLNDRLVCLAARAIVAELHDWRDSGRLRGSDGRQRFAEFVRQLTGPDGLCRFFCTYPVLARLLAETSRFEAEALATTLTRFAADRTEIVRVVLGGTDPGALCAVGTGQGDPHQRGDVVRVLRFSSGARIVYKPRGIGTSLGLAELIAWLKAANPGLDLRSPIVHACGEYGWMEFVAAAPLADPAAAAAYYRRLGSLLALLYIVHATDMHCENIIAAGDQPVVVDAETLFHPSMPGIGSNDPAARVLAGSVARTALLPSAEVGEHGVDTSALTGSVGAVTWRWEAAGTDQMRFVGRALQVIEGPSRPRLGGRVVDPAAYQRDLLHGFRSGYDAARRDRQRLAEIVRRCADLHVRVVLRPTREYHALLDALGDPDVLRDGLDRDQALDALWTSAPDELRRSAAPHEALDLWAGDVPLFQTRPGGREVWASDRTRLPTLLAEPEIDRVTGTIDRLGDVDLQDQEWIVKATMAIRRPVPAHRLDRPALTNLDAVAAPPQRLLAAACEVADRLVACGIADGDRVSWLGVEPVDEQRWLLLPTGLGLAHGTLGIALFLAHAARLSGVPRYATVARSAVRAYPQLRSLLADQPHLAAAVGCGGLSGLGGMAYGLGRLAVLLDDAELATLAAETVDLAATVTRQAPPDWRDGLAGCLAAMLAVYRELGLRSALALAQRCADLLVLLVRRAVPGDVPEGFVTGWGGIAYALYRMAEMNSRYRPLAARATALTPSASPISDGVPGWCAGEAGRVLAATVAGRPAAAVERDLRALTARQVPRDLSLCHGEMGVAEVLTVLAEAGHPQAARERNRRAGLVLDAIHRHGPICGTPDEMETPGLLTGLAGIGYGLLRVGFAAQVPSVLLLQPVEPAG